MSQNILLHIIVTLCILAGSAGFRPVKVEAAEVPTGACAQLTVEQARSDACDAEIVAHPLPELVHPVEFDPERDLEARPRSFLFPETPFEYPVGWQRRAWYFSDAPGVLPINDYTNARRVPRELMYYIYRSVEVDGKVWHLIAPGQWMMDEYVSVLQIPERPEGVSGRWVALDLTQQTLVAFMDDKPIFSTLISSGYYLITEIGLFHVYARADAMIMRGPPGANPPLYSFYTEHVMFFNKHQGLHAMPYHNDFGMKRSHGCVNVPPGDELWLWNFFAENIEEWDPSGTDSFRVDNEDAAPWVYVYESPKMPEWP